MNHSTIQANLLFVDSELSILQLLQRIFLKKGYNVYLSNSCENALILLKHQSIDLIVADMRMPLMNGDIFLKIVEKKWPKTRRILIAEFAGINKLISVINDGSIDSFITKPWDPEKLCQIISTLLNRNGNFPKS